MKTVLSILFYIVMISPDGLAGQFQASIGSVEITPPKSASLAGYGSGKRRDWNPFKKHKYSKIFKASKGVNDPLMAHAMIFENGEDLLWFISVDMVGVSKKIRNDLIERLSDYGVNDSNLFLSATHTHSGSGGLSRNRVFQLMATDYFQPELYSEFLDKVVTMVIEAHSQLQPAKLYSLSVEIEGMQKNRRKKGDPIDNEARLLIVEGSDGDRLGGLVNFAVHGTSLGARNRKFSADMPGAVAAAAERVFGGNFLFVQGASGDVGPTYRGLRGLSEGKLDMQSQLFEAMENLKPVEPVWSVKKQSFKLGTPRLRLRACVENKLLRWLVKLFEVPMTRSFPKNSDVWTVQLDQNLFVSIPGELNASVGFEIAKVADEEGLKPWILGLTNDHLGYFTSDEEFKEGNSTSACTAFYGRKGGERIVKSIVSN